MSEVNTNTQTVQTEPEKRWAIVQTGIVTKSSEVIAFKDDEGKPCPQFIMYVKSKEKGERLISRLKSVTNRIRQYGKDENNTSAPLYRVLETVGPAKKNRPPMTEEQKKAFVARTQASRKRGRGK